jgi:hypothetical protein
MQQKRVMATRSIMMNVTIARMIFCVKRGRRIGYQWLIAPLTSGGWWVKLSTDAIFSANSGLLLRLLSVLRDGRELCL